MRYRIKKVIIVRPGRPLPEDMILLQMRLFFIWRTVGEYETINEAINRLSFELPEGMRAIIEDYK